MRQLLTVSSFHVVSLHVVWCPFISIHFIHWLFHSFTFLKSMSHVPPKDSTLELGVPCPPSQRKAATQQTRWPGAGAGFFPHSRRNTGWNHQELTMKLLTLLMLLCKGSSSSIMMKKHWAKLNWSSTIAGFCQTGHHWRKPHLKKCDLFLPKELERWSWTVPVLYYNFSEDRVMVDHQYYCANYPWLGVM